MGVKGLMNFSQSHIIVESDAYFKTFSNPCRGVHCISVGRLFNFPRATEQHPNLNWRLDFPFPDTQTKDQPFSFACFCVYRQSSFEGKGSSKAVERIREEVLFYTAAARRNNKAQ